MTHVTRQQEECAREKALKKRNFTVQQTAKLRPEECSVKVMGKRGREWEKEGKRAGSTVDREQRQARGGSGRDSEM